MSRTEKRLWLIWLCLLTATLIGSAWVFVSRGGSLGEFPLAQFSAIRRALRPDREPKKFEKVSSVSGVTDIHIFTTATNVRITRNEALQDLSATLEGSFLKSSLAPLSFEKAGTLLSLRVDEGLSRVSWTAALDDSRRNSELLIVLPRQFSGSIEIETVTGETRLIGLSLSQLVWKSVSGALENQGGEIHIVRLQSVNGDVDFEGESLDFQMNLTSANGRIVLRGLEHLTNPRIDLQSVSGRIDLGISRQASLRISMSSFTGQTITQVDLKRSMHSGGALEGQLGAGAGELRLRSVSGTTRLTTF